MSRKRLLEQLALAAQDMVQGALSSTTRTCGKASCLLEATSRVVGQAKKFSREIAERVKRGNRTVLSRAKKELDKMIPRVQQVIRQTRERVLEGNTRAEEKILSLFEPETEVIRKGKTHKPNEFGKLVKIQEAEKQIITDYQVCEQRPADSTFWPEAKVNWRPYHLTRTPARLRPWSALPGTTCGTVWARAGGGGGRSRILLRGQ